MSRLPPDERRRWLGVLIPSLLAMLIGIFAVPQLSGLFIGAGAGWIVAGIFIFRSAGPRHVKTAVKRMRKGELAEAIVAMNAQINEEPDKPEHYRFRAELHRLAGHLKSARKDYRHMIALDDRSAVAHNGLAEVELQAGRLKQAHDAAARAMELAQDEWVAAYNLGMIEDRLGESDAVIHHIKAALSAKIPESRHRLLAHLYLWRANARFGAMRLARTVRWNRCGGNAPGLEEWAGHHARGRSHGAAGCPGGRH